MICFIVDDLKAWGEMIFGVKVANCIGQVQRFFTGFGNDVESETIINIQHTLL
jgi:hypothetical protein